MWDLEPNSQFNRRYKYYEKKHPRELTAVMSNLEVVQQALLEGADPKKFLMGLFIENRKVLSPSTKSGAGPGWRKHVFIFI